MQIASPTYHQTIGCLNAAVEHFLKTGFILLEDPKVDYTADITTRRRQYERQKPPMPHVYLRKTVRKIAKDLKRPIIVAETSYYPEQDGTIKVKIRKLKRHAPLMNTILLTEPYSGKRWEADRRTGEDRSTFRWVNGAGDWLLFFIGTKGREQFDEWMEFIQTNPECRKALKIPSPAGETDGTSVLACRDQNRLQRQEEGQALREGAAHDVARSAGDRELAC